MRTNAVFMGFSATLDTVSISFNSFFWMTIFRFFLLWHFQQSSWNRTLTYPHFAFIGYNHGFRLGGYCYIHLTTRTNAVFPGFFDLLAPAAIIYNSITSVMNYLFLISSDFSDFASLSDPQTLSFFFKRVPPWFYLRRRLLYPFNYENKCRIFKLFSLFRLRWPSLWNQSLLWWIIGFLISTFLYATVQIELLVIAFYSLTALTMVAS